MKYFEVSHFNVISPARIGAFTGSVRSMTSSKYFLEVMKEHFKLTKLRFWFAQLRNSKGGKFDRKNFTPHLEIDRKDLPKRASMEQYLNQLHWSLDSSFFGTLIMLTTLCCYFFKTMRRKKLTTIQEIKLVLEIPSGVPPLQKFS